MRNNVAWDGAYTESSVKTYLDTVAETRLELENITGNLSTLDVEFETIDFMAIDEFPRSLEAAATLVSANDDEFEIVDLGGIKLRENLSITITDNGFLTGGVISSDGKTEKSFVFDLELSQNDVVTDRNEPIQPFFEILKNKQNELISRYNDAFATDDASQFTQSTTKWKNW